MKINRCDIYITFHGGGEVNIQRERKLSEYYSKNDSNFDSYGLLYVEDYNKNQKKC